jgi:tetratricopeptide (TPR) repeat protein
VEWARILYNRAISHFHAQQHDRAKADLAKAGELQCDLARRGNRDAVVELPKTYACLGMVFSDLGREAESTECFDRAIAIALTNHKSRVAEGEEFAELTTEHKAAHLMRTGWPPAEAQRRAHILSETAAKFAEELIRLFFK